METSKLIIYVNGKKITRAVNPEKSLLSFLRTDLKLCGTKAGCREGGCGACTVMVSDFISGKIRHRCVNACLIPVVSLHGTAVTTVEGIGSVKDKMHSIQKRIADSHGSQCGFCTPGIVMSMYTLLRNDPQPKMEDIETYLLGNLCRCTGYRPIIEGFQIYTDCLKDGEATRLCKGGINGKCCREEPFLEKENSNSLLEGLEFIPPDESQEPIFPPELAQNPIKEPRSMYFQSESMSWYRPAGIEELLSLKARYPKAKIVAGNTEVGVEMRSKSICYPIILQCNHISEMNEIYDCEEYVSFGAAVSLTDIESFIDSSIKKYPIYKTRVLVELKKMLKWFAGKQIRNVASIGGNIVTGSPISDLNPILMAADSELVLQSASDGERTIPHYDQSFFSGYRKTIMKPNEILVSVKIPWIQSPNEYFYAFKQSRRRDDDIAIVNAAFYFKVNLGFNEIETARMAFGGMNAFTVSPKSIEKCLTNKPLNAELMENTARILVKELSLPPDAPGGMIRYRQSLAVGFFVKAFVSLVSNFATEDNDNSLMTTYKSCISDVTDVPFTAAQFFQRSAIQSDAVYKPLKHQSADKQATGEALYVDDMPQYHNELHVGWVLSSKAKARILNIDPSSALSLANVVDFICYDRIKGKFDNRFQLTDRPDETIFAENEVNSVGQIIGIVLVEGTQEEARRAAALVQIEYEDWSSDAIFTIEEAIEKKAFYSWSLGGPDHFKITRGNPREIMQRDDISVLNGSMRTGAQDHFYLETHSALVVPGDGDEYNAYSSTQNPHLVQKTISKAIGVSAHKIFCHNKRIGGGFGGKQRSMPFTLPVAIAAKITGRPVRMMLDRDEDMLMTGQRHPFLANYKIGYEKDGRIRSLVIDLYNNGGHTIDLSAAVMSKAMFHCDNAYNFPDVEITGRVCKTNIASNTAFRGFGAPQAMMMVEAFMDKLARTLKMNPIILRPLNFVEDNQITYYGQQINNCSVRRCWEECLTKSSYLKDLEEIQEFNRKNQWKKKGISIIPTKYGIAYGVLFLHQATALVHVYESDGSVLISHGGTEMGQGLYTKSIQVASQVLGIPTEKIHISETSTKAVPNGSVTGASVGTDLYGQAVMNACVEINDRLRPYKEKDPNGDWSSWVSKAYFDRVQLTVSGFFSVPDIDPENMTGNRFNYFTYGAGCSVVEIDTLTGEHSVLKTTIVMDLGQSINPAIDIGQIEGAFVQGYGMFTMEEMLHSCDGRLLTRGPGTYKIPGFGDIPKEFNVHLLEGSSNPRAVYSSKAVGEPPLFLSSSVFFAIKNAISAARHSEEDFSFNAPATCEKIRMACLDRFTDIVPELPEKNSYTPWSIQI